MPGSLIYSDAEEFVPTDPTAKTPLRFIEPLNLAGIVNTEREVGRTTVPAHTHQVREDGFHCYRSVPLACLVCLDLSKLPTLCSRDQFRLVDGMWVRKEGEMEVTFCVPPNRRKGFEELLSSS